MALEIWSFVDLKQPVLVIVVGNCLKLELVIVPFANENLGIY